jgi:hypothetical protein
MESVLETFLQLYAPALEVPNGRLALFRLPEADTFASRDTRKLVQQAVAWNAQLSNVYCHVHVHDLPEGVGTGRGSIESVRAAIGLFSDVDACGPGRKKAAATLCPTMRDVALIAEKFNARFKPLKISLVIGSGYGAYLTLLFREPMIIATPSDRELLNALARRFHGALHGLASEHGWVGAADFCDLAKTLRPPGTFNYKDPANPQRVDILFHDHNARFSLMDLEELLPARAAQNKAFSGGIPDAETVLVLDPNANPPEEKFQLLFQLDPEFAWTWNHERPHMPDQSASGYDMALAVRAARVGWSDQEVTDLLIAHRRYIGANLKLRPDYYRRTAARARQFLQAGETDQPPAAESEGTETGPDRPRESTATPKSEDSAGESQHSSGEKQSNEKTTHSGQHAGRGQAGRAPLLGL